MSSPSPLEPLLEVIRDVSELLDEMSIPHMFIGGIAVCMYSTPRMTKDVDAVILLDDSQWKNFLDKAQTKGIVPRKNWTLEFTRQSNVFLLTHTKSNIDIDISVGALPFEEQAIEKSITLSIQNISFKLVSVQNLITMKAIAHRPKDLIDISHLLESNPTVNLSEIKITLKEFSDLLEVPEILEDFNKIVASQKTKK